MAETKYQPVPHDHKAFLKKARKRPGFQSAYDTLTDKRLASPERVHKPSVSTKTASVVSG